MTILHSLLPPAALPFFALRTGLKERLALPPLKVSESQASISFVLKLVGWFPPLPGSRWDGKTPPWEPLCLLMLYYWKLTTNSPCLSACPSKGPTSYLSVCVSSQSAPSAVKCHYIPSDFALTTINPHGAITDCVYMHTVIQLLSMKLSFGEQT